MALQLQYENAVGDWLFDCGERNLTTLLSHLVTTYHINQLKQREKRHNNGKVRLLKTTRISKIFITHMHGDHVYGLPTLLSDLGMGRAQGNSKMDQPIDIYGPPTLSQYLTTVFQLTGVKCNFPCRIHELFAGEHDPRLSALDSSSTRIQYDDKRMSVEPVFPGSDGHWHLFSVSAACAV